MGLNRKRCNRIFHTVALVLLMQVFVGMPAFSKELETPKIEKVHLLSAEILGANPSIYKNYVVYTDYINGNCDIYLYDLLTKEKTRITDNPKEQRNPVVWGDKIVYEDNRNGSIDLYVYDLKTKKEYPIALAPGDQISPRIFENKIVWEDHRNPDSDIYLYDLAAKEEKRITANPAHQLSPAIFGDRIVWEDHRDGDRSIYTYEISKGVEMPLPLSVPKTQVSPDIYEQKIVWSDYRNGNPDIYMFDLETQTETQITNNSISQERPRIYGNYIVWSDVVYSFSHSGVQVIETFRTNSYAYDLTRKTAIPLSVGLNGFRELTICGGKAVWIEIPKSKTEIYMVDLSERLPKVNIELQVGNPNLKINGKSIEIDPGRGTKPVVINGTTLIPIRAFIEALGGTVEWTEAEKKVTISIIDQRIELWTGNTTAKVNGETMISPVPPQEFNGRTMLPIRFVAEALNLEVKWNGQTGLILISSEGF